MTSKSEQHGQPFAVSLPGRQLRLRALARWRRFLVWMLLLGPVWLALGLDVWRRAPRLAALDGMHRLTYLGALVESGVVWGLLVHAAARQRGWWRHVTALMFVSFATLAHAGQAYFFEQFNVYLTSDVARFAADFTGSVVQQFLADLANYLSVFVPAATLAILWVFLARRWVRPVRRKSRLTSLLAPAALLASFFIPTQQRQAQASTPDVLYLNAVGELLTHEFGLTEPGPRLRPRARASLFVPKLESRAPVPRNVVLFILESVRDDSACVDYQATGCRKTPFSNRLLPNRVPLRQMRSLSSTTAISLAVLWTGLGPEQPRDVIHTWPLIFDYARAAGVSTAFWTSQNMLFGNARLWIKNLEVNKFVSATELDPLADLDMGADEELLAARVQAEISELREPFLAVIQLSNTHYPFRVEADVAQPFQPATTSKAPASNRAFKNHYQNSVYQQDRHVARMLESIRQAPGGARTVVLYTSDHGEAFREHFQMGHSFSIFDEEIKVPAWVDAPAGTLSNDEARALQGKRDEFVFHVDIAPTILDLMGVWDAPGIHNFRARMLGTSLLRPERTELPLPMTNCGALWGCAFENWGVMQRNLKLEARAWDPRYRCYDVRADPLEQHALDNSACASLKAAAALAFPRHPGQPATLAEK